MSFFRPRIRNVRPFIGSQQRETGSAGEFVAGYTSYLDTGAGQELYDVNYVTFGGRSDSIQNTVLALQGDELIERRVGSCESDEQYVGTIDENAGFAINPDGEPVVLEVATSAAA